MLTEWGVIWTREDKQRKRVWELDNYRAEIWRGQHCRVLFYKVEFLKKEERRSYWIIRKECGQFDNLDVAKRILTVSEFDVF